MTYTETQTENARKAVAALRAADDSMRLLGYPLEKDAAGGWILDGKMCACAVVAKGVGIPLVVTVETGPKTSEKVFNYEGIHEALGLDPRIIYRFNDAAVDMRGENGERIEKPDLTFSQIGDELAAILGVE